MIGVNSQMISMFCFSVSCNILCFATNWPNINPEQINETCFVNKVARPIIVTRVCVCVRECVCVCERECVHMSVYVCVSVYLYINIYI